MSNTPNTNEPAMTDLVAQLVGALEDCLDDSHQVLAQMEQMYGTNYRQDRLEAQRKTIADAEAALSAAKDGGWQDIGTAPEGTMILCANMNAREARDWCFVAWMADGKVCGHRMDKPTHWQPLPNPPKGEV